MTLFGRERILKLFIYTCIYIHAHVILSISRLSSLPLNIVIELAMVIFLCVGHLALGRVRGEEAVVEECPGKVKKRTIILSSHSIISTYNLN